MVKLRIVAAGAVALLGGAGYFATRAQDPPPNGDSEEVQLVAADRPELPVSDPNCTFFGPERERFLKSRRPFARAQLTHEVAAQLPSADAVMTGFQAAAAITAEAYALPSPPGGSRTDTLQRASFSNNTIDKYIFEAIAAAGVTPAPPTTDFEFVRRVYLDLTGRIPTPAQVLAFVSDVSLDKRAKLVDTLVGSPEYIDKWTMWFGDHLRNNSRNTQITRYIAGVVAFNDYIRSSVAANKPYNQMVREMIAAEGTNSWTQGELNFLIGGFMGGGPVQDIFDEQLAYTVDTFLGISHMECILCHSGRGHLDELSLWGYYASRQEAYGMASFMSHTATVRTPVPGANLGNPYYWGLRNNVNGVTTPIGAGRYNYTNDYPLNTDTGNRPARGARTDAANIAPNTPRVAPRYMFDGASPPPGSDYRAFLAQKITSDFQFARATVNYMWEYFFGIGLVNPSNQFDPDRLDPDNPPSNCPSKTPCTLQASNPRLLNELAQDFINSGYDIRALHEQIVNSRAYQLSSRYEGQWNSTWQNLFARKLVRRLWSEEIHDAIAQSSNIIPTYTGNFNLLGSPVNTWGPVNWAMKFPEPLTSPGGGTNLQANADYLNAFLRGNRDDEPRRQEGSIGQALALMNDPFVMNRVRSTAASSLIRTALALPDDQLVVTLYLTVLSRYPTESEMSTALNNLKTNRTQEAQNLLWSLYNSVSFVFNY
jgi:hypothetical protein